VVDVSGVPVGFCAADASNVATAKLTTAANAAKAGCPISRLLKANVTMDAKLAG